MGLVLAGCAGLVALLVIPVVSDTSDDLMLNAGQASPGSPDSSAISVTVDAKHPVWSRLWRQPLYDPPPPPPVAVAPRPITVKLKGTIIESENSQAFIETANGVVELKRVGDLLTNDPADGTIAKIAATQITISRDDGEHELKAQE